MEVDVARLETVAVGVHGLRRTQRLIDGPDGLRALRVVQRLQADALAVQAVHFPDEGFGRGVDFVQIAVAVVVTDVEVGRQLAAGHTVGVLRSVEVALRRDVFRTAGGLDPVEGALGHDVEIVARMEVLRIGEGDGQVLHLDRVDLAVAVVVRDVVAQLLTVVVAQPGLAAVQGHAEGRRRVVAHIAAVDDLDGVLEAVGAFKFDLALIGGFRAQAILGLRIQHLQFPGFLLVHQRLTGGQLYAEVALAVVDGLHIHKGRQLAHQAVALVIQVVGIADPFHRIGRDLLVDVGDGLGDLVDAGDGLVDGLVHVALQLLDAVHRGGEHIPHGFGIGEQRLTVGRAVGIERQILPGIEEETEGGVHAGAVGLVEEPFQRGHDGVLLVPAGGHGGLAHVGAFQEGVIVTQHLLGVDPQPLSAGLGLDGVGIALIDILARVTFGIRIGDIIAGNGYPRLRGVQGRLPYVHQTTQHNHSLPEIMAASGCAL